MSQSSSEPRYLLDTNIMSHLVRRPAGEIAQHAARVGEDRICTSVIVAGELRYGAAKKASPRLSQQLEAVLAAIEVVALEPPASIPDGELRADLERRGRLIGPNDLLIAAHALSLGHVLVTDNEAEFRRIPGLVVENWLRETP